MTWKRFLYCWLFGRDIHQSPEVSSQGASMFSWLLVWTTCTKQSHCQWFKTPWSSFDVTINPGPTVSIFAMRRTTTHYHALAETNFSTNMVAKHSTEWVFRSEMTRIATITCPSGQGIHQPPVIIPFTTASGVELWWVNNRDAGDLNSLWRNFSVTNAILAESGNEQNRK